MSDTFKVGLVQNCGGADMAKTLDRARDLAREAVAGGAQLVVLPEFFACYHVDDTGIHTDPRTEAEHPGLAMFRDFARETGAWTVLGSLAISAPGGRSFNRQFVIDDKGAVRATYDKIHLFDVNIGADERYRESASIHPGERAVVTETPWGPMGLTICYDVRFPHLHRDLAKAGAMFLTSPAAFTAKTGEAHWHVLLRARAIETGCYVFAPCQSGSHGRARTYAHSLVVGPWGDVLVDAGEEECAVVVEIDPAEVGKARGRIPALKHDRPYDIVGDVAGDLESAAE